MPSLVGSEMCIRDRTGTPLEFDFAETKTAFLLDIGREYSGNTVDAFVDETANRKTRGGTADAGHKVGGFPIVQSRVAEAAANIETGFGILRHDLENNYAAAKSGAGLSITRRIENRRNQAMAMRLAVQAVNALFSCVGGSGLLLNQPVQRAWRDVNAAARHAGLNWDVQSTLSGRHALGYDTPGGY